MNSVATRTRQENHTVLQKAVAQYRRSILELFALGHHTNPATKNFHEKARDHILSFVGRGTSIPEMSVQLARGAMTQRLQLQLVYYALTLVDDNDAAAVALLHDVFEYHLMVTRDDPGFAGQLEILGSAIDVGSPFRIIFEVYQLFVQLDVDILEFWDGDQSAIPLLTGEDIEYA